MEEIAIEPQKGLNFEQVWVMFKETAQQLRESSADFDRRLKETSQQLRESSADFDRRLKETSQQLRESREDFDRQLKETAQQLRENSQQLKESREDFDRRLKETDRRMQKTDKEIRDLSKNIGGLNNSLGKLLEEMFSAKLWEKFDVIGFTFTQGGNRKFIENKQVIAEADVFLENGEYAMPVEVKVHLKKEDVDEHIERIELIRSYMNKRGDKRRLVGAVAGGIVPVDVRRYAQKQGLYVLEQSGKSVIIAKSPDCFTARLW